MAVLTKQALRRTFSGKCGAEQDESRDHVWYYFLVGDRTYARTKVSHGRGDLGARLVSRIARQLGLSQRELTDLVSCRLDAGNFHAHLVERGPFTTELR